jgi:hypothetical protein
MGSALKPELRKTPQRRFRFDTVSQIANRRRLWLRRPGGFEALTLMTHPLNFAAGWWLVLAAFASGAVIGLGFHREEFLGGYGSFRRRLVRLGHIAMAALGMLNIVYGIAPVLAGPGGAAGLTGMLFLGGAISMPLVCFLSAWRTPFRHLFFIPVIQLMAAVVLVLRSLA